MKTLQSAIIQGGERTWSAVAVDTRLNALLTATDQFAVALTNGLAANRKKYDRDRQGVGEDANYTYYRSTLDFALTTSWDEFVNAYAQ